MEKSCHAISHGNFIPYLLHKLNGGSPNFPPYKRTQDFHPWVLGPRPCRRYPPHLGAVDPPHLGGVLSGPRCRSPASSSTFFHVLQANVLTRRRWMFKKPAKKHTVVLLREKASTTQLRRKQDSDSYFIMFCARLTWIMFDQPCNMKLLEYQILLAILRLWPFGDGEFTWRRWPPRSGDKEKLHGLLCDFASQ